MDDNRAKNAGDAIPAKGSKMIAPNRPVPQDPLNYLWTPSLDTISNINEAHYQGGVSGSGPYSKSYEDKIPYTGDRPEGAETLKGR